MVRWEPVAGEAWRVLSPRDPMDELWVCPPSPDNLGLIVGTRDGLLRLGVWFRMAAFSRLFLVHLPTGGPLRDGVPWHGPPGGSVDLVIMRRDLGMPPSAWPGIRRRLPAARRVTLRPPPARAPLDEWSADLRLAEHGDTLLIIGPAATLAQAGNVISQAAESIASDASDFDVYCRGWSYLDELTWLIRGGGLAPQAPELDLIGVGPRFGLADRARPGAVEA